MEEIWAEIKPRVFKPSERAHDRGNDVGVGGSLAAWDRRREVGSSHWSPKSERHSSAEGNQQGAFSLFTVTEGPIPSNSQMLRTTNRRNKIRRWEWLTSITKSVVPDDWFLNKTLPSSYSYLESFALWLKDQSLGTSYHWKRLTSTLVLYQSLGTIDPLARRMSVLATSVRGAEVTKPARCALMWPNQVGIGK